MTSLPVRPRQLTAAGALATAVLLAGAGITAAAPTAPDDKVQVVHVAAASQQERTRVNALGLDTTEHGDRTGVEVVLHSAADAQKLRAAGFTWRVEDADLAATMRTAAAADRAYAASVAESPLPSGRTSYRTLPEVNAELDALAAKYPGLVRPADPGEPQRARQADPRHRDHQGRRQRRRRQAGVPHDGRAPRPRVAVGRALDGVRLRPAREPGHRRARQAHRRGLAHDHRAGRQRRRLRHQPLRRPAR